MPDTNPDAVKLLSDDEVAKVEARRARCLDNKDQSRLAEASILIASDIPALCATVRALRSTHSCGAVQGNVAVGGCGNQVSVVDGFRCADCLAWFHRNCINEHFKLDAYVKKLRELREQGAIDDWKKSLADKEDENTALREQLAELQRRNDTQYESIVEYQADVKALQSQLAQVTQERDRWRSKYERIDIND